MARYTPTLSQLINLSFFPDELSFLKDGINSQLSNLYYKDLRSSDSSGTNRSISNITIISNSPLDFELGKGTGFKIIFNPNNGSTQTETNVTYGFQWGILNFFRDFDFKSFDFSDPQSYLDLLIKTSGINESDLLEYFVRGQFEIPGIEDPIDEFIQYFNSSSHSPTTPLSKPNLPSDEEIYDDLVVQLSSNGNSFQVSDIVFQELLLGTSSASEIEEKLFLVFKYVHDDFAQYLRNLITPQFFGILNDIGIAISFPRSLLIPLDSNGKPLPGANDFSTISWTADRVSFSSKQGFNISSDNSLSLSPSQIGKTGLTIDATNIKVDFNEQLNIAEADNDGRPVAFKGVFIGSVNIGFPEDWVKSASSTATISGTNLLIGSPGGISGTIDIDSAGLLKFDVLGLSVELSTFQLEFKQNAVVSSDVTGTIIIPGLKDGSGNEAELDFIIDWSIDGYNICVSEPQGLPLVIPDVVEFTLNSLCIGQQDGNWQFSVQGRIERLLDIPMVGKAIPKFMDINSFSFGEGADTEFDLTFGWDGEPTVNLTDDSGAVEETFHINKDFLGVLEVQLIKFALSIQSERLQLDSTVDATVDIGPLAGAVEGIGFRTIVEFVENGGNLGPADLSFELINPTGVGVEMKSPWAKDHGFSIAGYISHDPSRQLYSGALSIDFKKITAGAVGILSLKLPNGQQGLSFLVIISAQFNPGIQLGMGFTLTGVGGLAGMNRTVNAHALREGVKEETFDNILFPQPPIIDKASQILASLDTAFPAAQGKFLIGPLAEISWGTKSLFRLQLGLIFESDALKITILGVLRAYLPFEEKEILRLQVNFIGEMDFGKKYIAFDASLFDSALLSTTLSGDFALRIYWGSNAAFLVTAGGFHPNFAKPTTLALPAHINRLSIVLVDWSNLKIKGLAYFAVTSNTIQFGAGVYVYAGLGKFSASADVSFDVLIYYRPKFRFEASIAGWFQIKYGRTNLTSISVEAHFTGPGRYHVHGVFEFKFTRWVTKTKHFNESFGTDKDTSLPRVDVSSQFREALQQRESWETTFPEDHDPLVVLRDAEELSQEILINPFSTISLNQKVVPLEVWIQRFGNAEPSSNTYFDITSVETGGQSFPLLRLQEQFAPAQFFAVDKDRLLTKASFKPYKSGIRFKLEDDPDYIICGNALSISMGTKEDIVIDGWQTFYTGYRLQAVDVVEASMLGGSSGDFFNNRGQGAVFGSFVEPMDIRLSRGGFVPVDGNGVAVDGVEFPNYEEGLNWIDDQLSADDTLPLDTYELVPVEDYNSYVTA